MMPAKGDAPEAIAIPRQRGNATKKTTKPDMKSDLISENILLIILDKI
jgi:hypothetical protein